MDVSRVVTCFLEYEGRIMLLRRSERVGTYRGRWAGVSGYIEEHKSPLEQAWLEIVEETGLGEGDVEMVREGLPVEVIDHEIGRKWIVHPVRFRVLKPDKIRIDWEHIEMKWVFPEDIVHHDTVPKLHEAWEAVAQEPCR